MPKAVVTNFVSDLWEFFRRLLGLSKKVRYFAPIITSERNSTFCRLLHLEINTPTSVGVWRAILQYAPYDYLLTCDRLQRLPATQVHRHRLLPNNDISKEHPFATHQIAINRISRYPVNNKIKVECLSLWRLDLVGMSGIAYGSGDRYASAVTKSLALELLSNHVDDIFWLERIDFYARKHIGSTHNAIGKN